MRSISISEGEFSGDVGVGIGALSSFLSDCGAPRLEEILSVISIPRCFIYFEIFLLTLFRLATIE